VALIIVVCGEFACFVNSNVIFNPLVCIATSDGNAGFSANQEEHRKQTMKCSITEDARRHKTSLSGKSPISIIHAT
jgi:hypothetical protein